MLATDLCVKRPFWIGKRRKRYTECIAQLMAKQYFDSHNSLNTSNISQYLTPPTTKQGIGTSEILDISLGVAF